MSEKFISGYDRMSGVVCEIEFDESERRMTINNRQNLTNLHRVIEYQKIIETKRKRTDDMKMIAWIPDQIWFELRQKKIIGDRVRFRRWLNDPDNAVFLLNPEKKL